MADSCGPALSTMSDATKLRDECVQLSRLYLSYLASANCSALASTPTLSIGLAHHDLTSEKPKEGLTHSDSPSADLHSLQCEFNRLLHMSQSAVHSSSGLAVAERHLVWLVLLGIVPFDCEDVLSLVERQESQESQSADVPLSLLQSLLSLLEPSPSDQKNLQKREEDGGVARESEHPRVEECPQLEGPRVEGSRVKSPGLESPSGSCNGVSDVCSGSNRIGSTLTNWLHAQLKDAHQSLDIGEIEQIDKDVLRATSLYPNREKERKTNSEVERENRNEGESVEPEKESNEESDEKRVNEVLDDRAVESQDTIEEMKVEQMSLTGEDASQQMYDNTTTEGDGQAPLPLEMLVEEKVIQLEEIPSDMCLSTSSSSFHYFNKAIDEWSEHDLLRCVIEIVVSRHGKSRSLMYTQGYHELAVMVLRVNGVFECMHRYHGHGHVSVVNGSNEVKSTMNDEPTNSDNTVKQQRSHSTNLLILLIFKSILVLERLSLNHNLCDYLTSPLELTMISSLKLVGYLLYIADPPLFSLLTFISQFDAVKSGNVSLVLSRQRQPQIVVSSSNKLDHLTGNTTEEAKSHCDSHSSLHSQESSSLSSDPSTPPLDSRPPLGSPSIPFVFQFLSGHEFQFCLSFLLTYFTHEFLPCSESPDNDATRYQLCCRVWDNLLSGPPQLQLCLCVAILLHPRIRLQLCEIAHRFGIIVETPLTSLLPLAIYQNVTTERPGSECNGCDYRSSQEAPACGLEENIGEKVLKEKMLEEKILEEADLEKDQWRLNRYPPLIDCPIKRNDIEESEMFAGLQFDHDVFDSREIDFMQIEIYKALQGLFQRRDDLNLCKTSSISLVEVVHESIDAASKLCHMIGFDSDEMDDGYQLDPERMLLQTGELGKREEALSTAQQKLDIRTGVCNLLYKKNSQINWPVLLRLTCLHDLHCEVPVYSSVRWKDWKWRETINRKIDEESEVGGAVKLMFKEARDDSNRPEADEQEAIEQKKENNNNNGECSEKEQDRGQMDIDQCSYRQLPAYTPIIYQFPKQDYGESLSRRKVLSRQKKEQDELELSRYLQSLYFERQEQPELWSAQRQLFISLLSSRLIYRLVNEWTSISRRLALAFHELFSREQYFNNRKNDAKKLVFGCYYRYIRAIHSTISRFISRLRHFSFMAILPLHRSIARLLHVSPLFTLPTTKQSLQPESAAQSSPPQQESPSLLVSHSSPVKQESPSRPAKPSTSSSTSTSTSSSSVRRRGIALAALVAVVGVLVASWQRRSRSVPTKP